MGRPHYWTVMRPHPSHSMALSLIPKAVVQFSLTGGAARVRGGIPPHHLCHWPAQKLMQTMLPQHLIKFVSGAVRHWLQNEAGEIDDVGVLVHLELHQR